VSVLRQETIYSRRSMTNLNQVIINIGLGLFVHAVDGLFSECGSVH